MTDKTKPQLEDELAAAQLELERLEGELADARGQLSVAVARTTPTGEHQAAARQPFLSEGERQELGLYGVTNSPFTGRRLTRTAAGEVLSEDQDNVQIPEPSTDLARQANVAAREVTPIEGVTHVWPSVTPGVLADDVRPPVAKA